MKKFLRISLISTAAFFGIYIAAALIMVFLPEPTFSVAPFPATESVDADFTELTFTARDGESLFARQFPAEADTTILLVHGATADSAVFNKSAQLLREATGAEIITLDLRGHGRSGGALGDVDYIGQYEDDLVDVITALQSENPQKSLILAGHSMGGGIALRFAELSEKPTVDGYLLFAPHLGSKSPTMPQPDPETAEFAAAYSQLHLPRLIGIAMLNGIGIKLLNAQDTLFFNLPDTVTHTYTYRALVNVAPLDYGTALSAVDAPMLVIVGSNDEAFVADAFPDAITSHSDGEVHIINGETHPGIVENQTAMTLVEQWFSKTEFTSR